MKKINTTKILRRNNAFSAVKKNLIITENEVIFL